MKVLFKLLLVTALTTAASSCSSFLDVNVNPNSPTVSAPDAILATALATTAANYTGNNPSYNSYGSFVAGYWGRSGTVNGYTEERTYNYTSSYYSGLFDNTYDNLNDYDIIQKQGTANGYPNHAAIARIMKVYNFQLLVDEYGDIPYTNALGGLNNLTPTYDKAADIYKDFIVQLDGAVADIKAAATSKTARTVGSEDIVFGGNMINWIKFANSLKLRVLLRESQTSDAALNTYVATQMATLQKSTDGFITADVVAQPGYSQSAGKQNPFFNRYGQTAAGSNATERSYQLPTKYILAQYVDNKDPRVSQLYSTAPISPGNYVGAALGETSPVLGSGTKGGSRFKLGGGLLKGFNAPTVLMLLSEHLFSKAEAETRGLFTGGDAAAKTDFQNGIQASFAYFYRPAPGVIGASNGTAEYNAYLAANATNPLVSYDAAATGPLGKQSVIIYQKYLALNTVGSIEAWDDYRRTAQPKFQPSLESTSTRADKLPTRLLYPISEVSANAGSIPAGVTQFTKIFWDVVD